MRDNGHADRIWRRVKCDIIPKVKRIKIYKGDIIQGWETNLVCNTQ